MNLIGTGGQSVTDWSGFYGTYKSREALTMLTLTLNSPQYNHLKSRKPGKREITWGGSRDIPWKRLTTVSRDGVL